MSMKQLFLATALLAGASISAQAATIYDNLTNGSGQVWNLAGDGDGPVYQSFMSGGSASTLTDVYLSLFVGDANSGGSIVITLLSDSGGSPDTILSNLGTFGDDVIGALSSDLHISTSFALSASTAYWVQVTDAYDVDNTTYPNRTTALWQYAFDDSGTGVAGTSSLAAGNFYTWDSGDPATAPLVMGIIDEASNNNVDTPEPATIGILGLSLLGVGWARRRRAAAAAAR